MVISEINSINLCSWSEFVNNHPDGNIFQSPAMYEAFKDNPLYQPVTIFNIDQNNKIKGILLGLIQGEPGLKKLFSKRCIITGGPLIADQDLQILEEILQYFHGFIKNQVIYTQFRNYLDYNWGHEIFKKLGFNYEDHLNILVGLQLPEEEFIRNIHKSRRRNYRRGINKGVYFKETDRITNINEFYNLIYQTYKRIKLPLFSAGLFTSAVKYFAENNMIRMFSAEYKSCVVAVRIVLLYKDKMFDWYAGSDEQQWNLYANDFLIYNVLNWGRENGYRYFDFGGAGKPGQLYGVRDHKEKFGGEYVNYGRYQIIHKPALYHLGKTGLRIYHKLA